MTLHDFLLACGYIVVEEQAETVYTKPVARNSFDVGASAAKQLFTRLANAGQLTNSACLVIAEPQDGAGDMTYTITLKAIDQALPATAPDDTELGLAVQIASLGPNRSLTSGGEMLQAMQAIRTFWDGLLQ